MRKLYLLLAIVGLVLPYYFFISFLIVNGLDLQLFSSQLFANNISTFFVVDLVITAIVFWAFLYQEAEVADGKLVGIHRCNVGNWSLLCLAVVSVLS
jgi:hypothetical protein